MGAGGWLGAALGCQGRAWWRRAIQPRVWAVAETGRWVWLAWSEALARLAMPVMIRWREWPRRCEAAWR